nr:uncharacterized protein LOC102067133 isoform X5 [Zonotrichia albicollis]
MTQPLFQHRLPFGLAPFQKPSPSTPFFPAFLLPPPPRLTVTLKQPPLPTPRFPPPPQTPSSGPWDAGELWHLPLILIQRSCFWNWRVRLWCLPAEEEAHSFLQSWVLFLSPVHFSQTIPTLDSTAGKQRIRCCKIPSP